MKRSEEIKKGLELCGVFDGDCENCAYDDGRQSFCGDRLRKDALAYIRQLEGGIDKAFQTLQSVATLIKDRLAQVERERDAAVFDLYGDCDVCKNGGKTCMKCVHCLMSQEATMDGWEWRGVCAENTEEDANV